MFYSFKRNTIFTKPEIKDALYLRSKDKGYTYILYSEIKGYILRGQ